MRRRLGHCRRAVAALFVISVALLLAVGVTSHHDDVAPTGLVDIATHASETDAGTYAPGAHTPDDDALVACSLALLCVVALGLLLLRARRTPIEALWSAPRATAMPATPPPPPAPAVCLDTLSISRT